MAIQSLGVGSGLDVNSIISQLMAIEQQPLKRLEKAAAGVQAEISAYGTIKSKVDALDTAVSSLTNKQTWQSTVVNLNGADEFTVTAGTNASASDLDISIRSMAQRQSVETKTFSSSSAAVGTGTLDIQLGTWSPAFGGFSPKTMVDDPDNPGNQIPLSVRVTIDATHQSLSAVRDAINAASAGVTASILNDSGGARLVIRSEETGEVNGFRISVSGASGELGALAFTGQTNPASVAGAHGNSQAANLEAELNGASVSSASNTLTDVLEGITIRALKPTTTVRAIAIQSDVEGMKTKVNAFVTAYNDLNAYLKQQTAYNASTKTASTLQGDGVAVSLQGRLRAVATQATGASTAFEQLSSVGVELQKDGTLKVDDTKLSSACNNLTELTKLFSQDDSNAGLDGVAVKLADLIDEWGGANGAITTKQLSLNERLSRNQADQDKLAERLSAVQARLKAQYSALDTKMASLSGLSQYVSQQVKLLTSSNSN